MANKNATPHIPEYIQEYNRTYQYSQQPMDKVLLKVALDNLIVPDKLISNLLESTKLAILQPNCISTTIS